MKKTTLGDKPATRNTMAQLDLGRLTLIRGIETVGEFKEQQATVSTAQFGQTLERRDLSTDLASSLAYYMKMGRSRWTINGNFMIVQGTIYRIFAWDLYSGVCERYIMHSINDVGIVCGT